MVIISMQTDEEQIRGINNKSLPSTVDLTHCIRHSQTDNTHPQQQSIGSVQSGTQKELRNPISPAEQSLTKSGRMSNTNLKNHFKAVIAGVDDNFPMNLWDRLLPQTVLTLNLL
jgi:hypothetical protein